MAGNILSDGHLVEVNGKQISFPSEIHMENQEEIHLSWPNTNEIFENILLLTM